MLYLNLTIFKFKFFYNFQVLRNYHFLDGSIYNGFTYKNKRPQLFKLNIKDSEKNLKTFAKDTSKDHIRSRFN